MHWLLGFFTFWNIYAYIMRHVGARTQSKHKLHLTFIYTLCRKPVGKSVFNVPVYLLWPIYLRSSVVLYICSKVKDFGPFGIFRLGMLRLYHRSLLGSLPPSSLLHSLCWTEWPQTSFHNIRCIALLLWALQVLSLALEIQAEVSLHLLWSLVLPEPCPTPASLPQLYSILYFPCSSLDILTDWCLMLVSNFSPAILCVQGTNPLSPLSPPRAIFSMGSHRPPMTLQPSFNSQPYFPRSLGVSLLFFFSLYEITLFIIFVYCLLLLLECKSQEGRDFYLGVFTSMVHHVKQCLTCGESSMNIC